MNAPERSALSAESPSVHQPPPLLPALLHHATQMNFFRFCELLERAAPDQPALGSTDSPANEAVRFRSRARLGFPGREIDGITYDFRHPLRTPTVRTTFLGLYGVDARMPSYFVDEIAQNHDGAEPLAGFLDLFHHRVLTQYYRVWRKYRYPAGFRHDGSDHVSRCLLSLIGLGFGTTPTAQALDPRKLLSMLGLASQKTRTAEGLAGVLRHAVPDTSITIEEFHPVWIAVAPGTPMPLGENCLLGRGFYDSSNTVRIVFAPHTRDAMLRLIPGHGTSHSEVMALLRFYLGYEAQAQLDMSVSAALMPAQQLGSQQVRLGYTTQLKPTPPGITPAPSTRVHLGAWPGGNGPLNATQNIERTSP
ncbi:type VI secretion system baseplate subunit TssG [Paraburkholderia bonniea]|uniref:type VI secretion system baseplate subunit TssG n=1 Tax=Paraburkholderia bonniea TaxID=2152891 RepID=UPI001FE3BAF4|nr:type VI secretion system baseplate subunit TssG [Paraburkholderia bonniea]